MNLLNIKINYSLFSPWIRPDITLETILSLSIRTVFCITATTSSNSSLLLKIFFKFTFSAFIPHPMLQLRQEPRISRNLDVALSFQTQVVCILSTSLFSFPKCCFVVVMPCHKSRSSSQFSVPKSSLVFLQQWFFVGGNRSTTPASLYRSLVLSLYLIVVRTRWLLDQLILTVLHKSLQESSVLSCAWLDIHCLLVWCTKLPGTLPFQNVGCIFCKNHHLSALSLLSMILPPPFAPTLL